MKYKLAYENLTVDKNLNILENDTFNNFLKIIEDNREKTVKIKKVQVKINIQLSQLGDKNKLKDT